MAAQSSSIVGNPFDDPLHTEASSNAPTTANSIVNRLDSNMSSDLSSSEAPPKPTPVTIPIDDSADVLTVDRNATLTLATDTLIVLDEGLRHRRRARTCCGLLPQLAKTTRAIPFTQILRAELDSFDIVTIKYAQVAGKKSCRVAQIAYPLSDKTRHAHALRWIERLLLRAYPAPVQRKLRIKVLVNPFGGQGYAQRIWEREVAPVFAAAQCVVDVERTARRGHAIDIAAELDVDAYDVVACASGDGLPHEVFNGLARQPRPRRALHKVAVVQLPCGSGNAMCKNLTGTDSPSLAALAIVKSVRTPLDLVAITQGTETIFSFLSQSVGIIADTDLGTESLRWMGAIRFNWGFLVRIFGKTVYPAEVSVVVQSDDKRQIKQASRDAVQCAAASPSHLPNTTSPDSSKPDPDSDSLPPLRYGTIKDPLPPSFTTQDLSTLGNFYAGNMVWMTTDAPFFPCALPRDGLLDLVNIDGIIPRLSALKLLIAAGAGKIIDSPDVSYRKVRAYRIAPRVRDNSTDSRSEAVRARVVRWLGGHAIGPSARRGEGLISIDGESLPFEPFQAEIVPGLGMTLSRSGALYEFELPE